MRILVLAEQWFPDYAGGTARVVRDTATGLAGRGHRVVVIAPRHDGEPEVSAVAGVEVRRAIRRSALPQTITDAYETRRAINALGERDFDLVLAHHVACATGALSANLRCPLAYVFHASPYLEARHRRRLGLGPIERWRSLGVEPPLYLQERLTLRRAAGILVLSEFSQGLVLDAARAAAGRVVTVGGGVDTRAFAPASDRDALRLAMGVGAEQRLIVTARRLVGRMGLEILLDAFARLHADDARAHLVIIGDGELRGALEARRDRLGLVGAVHFTGRVPDGELRDWYRAADVFVLPTVAYEGFGMVTAEALACGTPVVGTQVGATAEVLAPLDRRLLAAQADIPSLVAAIDRALAWASPRMRMACRRYAEERLDWNTVIARWEQALTRLVPKAPRHQPAASVHG